MANVENKIDGLMPRWQDDRMSDSLYLYVLTIEWMEISFTFSPILV